MAGRTRLMVTDEVRGELERLAASSDRAEADRARAILRSGEGQTGEVIGRMLGVRADTVRAWRRRFRTGGVAALRTRLRPGRAAWKSPAALRVVEDLLAAPVADRVNWTLPRLQRAIRERTGTSISISRLSVAMRQKGLSVAGGHATPSRGGRTRTPWSAAACG